MRKLLANKWVQRGGKAALLLIALDAMAAVCIVALAYWNLW